MSKKIFRVKPLTPFQFVKVFYKTFGLKLDIEINGSKGYVHNIICNAEMSKPFEIFEHDFTNGFLIEMFDVSSGYVFNIIHKDVIDI